MGEKLHPCPRCGRTLPARFSLLGQSKSVCVVCAVQHRPFMHDALRASAVVGTLLTAVNQGHALLFGSLSVSVGVRVLITYAVPFAVSFYTSVHLCAVMARLQEPLAGVSSDADAS